MKTLVVDRSTDEQSLALVEGEAVVAETTLAGTDCRSGDWVLKVREFISPLTTLVMTYGYGDKTTPAGNVISHDGIDLKVKVFPF